MYVEAATSKHVLIPNPHCILRPYIAELNGVDWKLFKTEADAVAATDEMIGKNRTEYPWIDGSRDVPSTASPALCSKFFYLHTKGH